MELGIPVKKKKASCLVEKIWDEWANMYYLCFGIGCSKSCCGSAQFKLQVDWELYGDS